jgi:hypothetical protein
MPLHSVKRRKPHTKSRSGCEQCRKRRLNETKGDNPELGISAAIYDLRRLNQTTSTQTGRIILDDVVSTLEQSFGGEIEEVSWLLSAGPEYIKLLREGEGIKSLPYVLCGIDVGTSQITLETALDSFSLRSCTRTY